MRGATAARLWIGVEVGAALNLVGALLKYLSLAFLFPVPIAIGYSEPWWPYVAAGALTAVGGWGLEAATRGKERVGVREGFLVVALTWLLGSVAIAISYMLSGEDQLSRPVDALFEAMSGMTTTGSSVVADVSTLDRSLSMWRQFTQWFGGMGIIVLALAVLPRLRVGGRQLMESEAPGPELEALTASIRDTARRLWLLYVALTVLLILILASFGWTGVDERMGLFNAVAYAFCRDADGRIRNRRALGGALRARLAVGARALHGDRGSQLRPALPSLRPPQAGRARARRGVPPLHRAARCSRPRSWPRFSGTPGSARGRRRSGRRPFRPSRS